jgi:hypothetical protein
VANFEIKTGNNAGLPALPYTDTVRRVTAYLGQTGSGWATYDLPSIHARRAGQFLTVGPWSLLLANALSGRVDQKNIAGFTLEHREDFARRIAAVPENTPLANLSSRQLADVVHLASFGFKGVWGPKTTKLAALYRPDSVPVLDSQMAQAFGLKRNAFSAGKQWKIHIRDVVKKIAAWLQDPANTHILARLRAEVAQTAPDITLISDVRLLDIILWTAQDDRESHRSTKKTSWLEMQPAPAPPLSSAAWVEITRQH